VASEPINFLLMQERMVLKYYTVRRVPRIEVTILMYNPRSY